MKNYDNFYVCNRYSCKRLRYLWNIRLSGVRDIWILLYMWPSCSHQRLIFLLLFIISVRNQFIPCTTSVDESQWGRVRPGGGWTDVGSRVAAPTAGLRVLPSVPRISRLSTQHGQTIYRPSICFAGMYLIYLFIAIVKFIQSHLCSAGKLPTYVSTCTPFLPISNWTRPVQYL